MNRDDAHLQDARRLLFVTIQSHAENKQHSFYESYAVCHKANEFLNNYFIFIKTMKIKKCTFDRKYDTIFSVCVLVV